MQKIEQLVKEKCQELLDNGTVTRVLGWKKGLFEYDPTPAVFTKETGLDELVYNWYCGANLSKYLIKECPTTKPVLRPGTPEPADPGKMLVLLKPCDSYSFNQLLTEHRIDRTHIYALGIPCKGKKKEEKDGAMLDRCLCCKGKDHVAYDELLAPELSEDTKEKDRFEEVARLEAMTAEERFAFWRTELSKCIRCNACRNVCPACSCYKCVFDNFDSGISSKANTDEFEENMFHIIRAFHVAGRCTDCGECSRVCPQGIPLHLLNRKFIKDIDELYGEYQAGAEEGQRGPLTNFTQEDCEPSIVYEKGGE